MSKIEWPEIITKHLILRLPTFECAQLMCDLLLKQRKELDATSSRPNITSLS